MYPRRSSRTADLAAPRTPGSRTKVVLEYGPVVAFVLGYLVVRERTYVVAGRELEGFVLLVGAWVPLLLAASAATWWRNGRIAPVQLLTLLVVAVSGGLTVWLNDERVFKMRTTVVCSTLAAVLGVGLMRGGSYLEAVMRDVITLSPTAWLALTRRLTGLLLMLAAANEIVWRGLSTDIWVAYDTFVQPVVFFGFMAVQVRLLGDRKPPAPAHSCERRSSRWSPRLSSLRHSRRRSGTLPPDGVSPPA